MDTMKRFEEIYEELNRKTDEIVNACRSLKAEKDFILDSVNQARSLIEETNKCISEMNPDTDSDSIKKAEDDLKTYQLLHKDYLNDLMDVNKKLDEAYNDENDFISIQEFFKNITDFNRLKNGINAESPIKHFEVINALKIQINKKYQELFKTSDVLILDDRLPLSLSDYLVSSYHDEKKTSNDEREAEYREYLKQFYSDRDEKYLTEVIQEVNLLRVINFGPQFNYVEEEEEKTVEQHKDDENEYTSMFTPVPEEHEGEFQYPQKWEFQAPLKVEVPKSDVNESVVYESSPVIEDEKEEVGTTEVANTEKTKKIEERQKNYDIYHMCLERELLSFAALRKEFAAKVMSGEAIDKDYYEKYNHSLKLTGLYEGEIKRLDSIKERISDLEYNMYVPSRMLNADELERFASTGSLEEENHLEINSMEEVFGKPKDEKESKSENRVFKFIRKASEKTKELVKKNKKLLLVAAFVTVAAASLSMANKKVNNSKAPISYEIEDDSYINVNDNIMAENSFPNISINSEKDEKIVNNFVEQKANRFINESSFKDDDVNNSVIEVESPVLMYDKFTLKPNTNIFTDEYVNGKGAHPYYGPDVERTVRFVCVRTDDKNRPVKMCSSDEEVRDLLAKGGEVISVYSPLEGEDEGFYKIDDINIIEKDNGRSL